MEAKQIIYLLLTYYLLYLFRGVDAKFRTMLALDVAYTGRFIVSSYAALDEESYCVIFQIWSIEIRHRCSRLLRCLQRGET